MLALFTFPTPSDLIDNVTYWSSPTFESYLPTAYFTIGVAIGAMLIVFLIYMFIGAMQYLVDKIRTPKERDEEIHPRYKIKNITTTPVMTQYLHHSDD